MSYKAYPKVNIFLKIVALRGNYHELVSRFVLEGRFAPLIHSPTA